MQASVEKAVNQPKRHHYIPIMLLKHFTGNDGQLHCCRQNGAEPNFWKALPQNAFVVKHLYTKHDSFWNPDTSVEKDLGAIESDLPGSDVIHIVDMLSKEEVDGRNFNKSQLTATNVGSWGKDLTIVRMPSDGDRCQ